MYSGRNWVFAGKISWSAWKAVRVPLGSSVPPFRRALGTSSPRRNLVGTRFSVPVGLDFKKVGKGVDRLDAHAVEAHGFFKGVAVVFGPRC